MSDIVVYCDEASDEIAAGMFLTDGPLPDASIRRLPSLGQAPAFLRPLLLWERLDWVICVDDEIRCTVELSRHGYTGDNGFQRFARLYRSASLGIPTIYFAPFRRTRLNELDQGQSSARNVAPELFTTLRALEVQFGVSCLAVSWPVDAANGQPAPLQSDAAAPVVRHLADVAAAIVRAPPAQSVGLVSQEYPDLRAAMDAHEAIGFRGTDTRGLVELPINIGSPDWVYAFLPDSYFRQGKAEKALASLALDSSSQRPLQGSGDPSLWDAPGRAWVLYLGYQWRPDPSCGLIALTATQAQARSLPLIVVWPRIFSVASGARRQLLDALKEFKRGGTGPLAAEMVRHGRASQIPDFASRVSTSSGQFGIFTPGSKIGRVVAETAAALVLGDVVSTFAHD